MKTGIVYNLDGYRHTLPVVEIPDNMTAYDFVPVGAVVVQEVENPFMWDNCIYKGRAVGHSHGFCTADACY